MPSRSVSRGCSGSPSYAPSQRQLFGESLASVLGAAYLRHWNADVLSSLSIDGSNRVASWTDIVAGIAYTQSVDADKPVYSGNGWNGSPCLTADGVSQNLILTPATFLTGTQTGEVWILCQQDKLAAAGSEFFVFSIGLGANVNDLRVTRVVSTVNRARLRVGNSASSLSVQDTTVDFSSRHVLRCIKGSTTIGMSIDTSGVYTGTVTGNISASRSRIFSAPGGAASNFWQGSIREIIITGLLTNAQADYVSKYLLARRAV